MSRECLGMNAVLASLRAKIHARLENYPVNVLAKVEAALEFGMWSRKHWKVPHLHHIARDARDARYVVPIYASASHDTT